MSALGDLVTRAVAIARSPSTHPAWSIAETLRKLAELAADTDTEKKALAAERDALHAIIGAGIAGQPRPPFGDELRTHTGQWFVRGGHNAVCRLVVLESSAAAQDWIAGEAIDCMVLGIPHQPPMWWAARDGRVCPWPVVEGT